MITMPKEEWTPALEDPESAEFKDLAERLTTGVSTLLYGIHGL